MAATDTSNLSAILKVLYSSDKIDNAVLPKSPCLGLMKKWEGFTAKQFTELLEYGDIKGVGLRFATAQTNAASSDEVNFDLTRKKLGYAVAQLTGEAIEASRGGDKAAFVSALKRQMDSALNALGQNLSHKIFRNKYSARGTVGSVDTGTNTITLANPDDICLFEKGMKVLFSADDGGVVRAVSGATTALPIASVNRDAGSFVYTGTDPTSLAAGDYIYRDSDTDAVIGTAGTGLGISGFDDWIPSTAPDSTSFFGVDRSVDTSRLGGIRFDASSYNILEGLGRALARAARDGAAPDHCFLPYANFQDAVDLLGSKVQYVTESAFKAPQVGFEGFKLVGPKGPVKVFPDQFCQANVAWLLTMRTWTLRSLNKATHILDLDKANLLRLASEDSYEIRWGGYGNLGCSYPGANVRVALA